MILRIFVILGTFILFSRIIFLINYYYSLMKVKKNIVSSKNNMNNLETILNEIIEENEMQVSKSELSVLNSNMFINGDKELLKQLISTFLCNIKNKDVVVETRKNDKGVILTLLDESKGCNKNLLKLISNINKESTYSLDLSVIKSMMDLYNIKIFVEGKIDSGTKVVMQFN